MANPLHPRIECCTRLPEPSRQAISKRFEVSRVKTLGCWFIVGISDSIHTIRTITIQSASRVHIIRKKRKKNIALHVLWYFMKFHESLCIYDHLCIWNATSPAGYDQCGQGSKASVPRVLLMKKWCRDFLGKKKMFWVIYPTYPTTDDGQDLMWIVWYIECWCGFQRNSRGIHFPLRECNG